MYRPSVLLAFIAFLTPGDAFAQSDIATDGPQVVNVLECCGLDVIGPDAQDMNRDGRITSVNVETGVVYDIDFGADIDNDGLGDFRSETEIGVADDFGEHEVDYSHRNEPSSFYFNLPPWITGSAVYQVYAWGRQGPPSMALTTRYVTKKSSDQNYLKNHLDRFRKRSIAQVPIIAYGLEQARFKLIRDVEDSPTFTALEAGVPTIYVNENDLWAYGPVVLTQELLHAAIKKARHDAVIWQWHYDRVAGLNERYFSHFDGYVGTNGPRGNNSLAGDDASLLYHTGFGREKAFTIGYSYLLLKENYGSFSQGEKSKVDQYFRDVEGNIKIADISIEVSEHQMEDRHERSYRPHQGPLHLLGSNVNGSQADWFVDQFLNSSSAVRKWIKPVIDRF